MKKHVFVIDDQPSVLDTTVLILQSADPEWKVVGFTDSSRALDALKADGPDLVIADQLMPEMPGSELMEHVRVASPRAIRVIMSGQVDLTQLRILTSAHQYIAKPFDAPGLTTLVRRGFAAQDRMRAAGLLEIVTQLRSLPSLPQVYHSLMAELEDSRSAALLIARLMAEHPALSTKILRLANSPLYAQLRPIAHPREAVLRLGTDMVQAIASTQTMFKYYYKLRQQGLDVALVWSHCWDVAQLAQNYCRTKGLSTAEGEQAFLAGLLHELGRFLLLENFPEQFQSACETARRNRVPLVSSLTATFKTSPARVASYLLELWGLPGPVVRAVSLQDNPETDGDTGFNSITALYVADQIASRKSPPDPFGAPEWNTDYLKKAGCLEDISEWEKAAPGSEP